MMSATEPSVLAISNERRACPFSICEGRIVACKAKQEISHVGGQYS